ncbi:MAG TPA: prepilin-type N-terminal cleavage/methylation domain-containing protein [Solirubrobacteraceae bacterium]
MKSLRARTSDEGGFTLIELLVVVLIIGILSAIAIPAFLSQTSKASDSAGKTQVGTLQTTMETFASEHNGSFETSAKAAPSIAELATIEPTLNDTSQATAAVVSASATGFVVSSTVKSSGDVYTLTDTAGALSRTCVVANTSSPGGCKELSGTKGSW